MDKDPLADLAKVEVVEILQNQEAEEFLHRPGCLYLKNQSKVHHFLKKNY